jgi:hypothetical protein
VEWNDIKSWVNHFTLNLNNPKSIISFARNNDLLDKMPFCHLTQYCRSYIEVGIARILKVSTSPKDVKYKFGIKVSRGIKNEIDLDKKNGNQIFIVLGSGEDISIGYQKLPYHMAFDVKYDLRHKIRQD